MEHRLVDVIAKFAIYPTYINAMALTPADWQADRCSSVCGWFVQHTLN